MSLVCIQDNAEVPCQLQKSLQTQLRCSLHLHLNSPSPSAQLCFPNFSQVLTLINKLSNKIPECKCQSPFPRECNLQNYSMTTMVSRKQALKKFCLLQDLNSTSNMLQAVSCVEMLQRTGHHLGNGSSASQFWKQESLPRGRLASSPSCQMLQD